MSKKTPLRSTRHTEKQGFNINEVLPQKYHIPAVIAVLIILYLIFLNPLFFGNQTFQSGDIIAIESAKPYVEKDRDGFSLWNPHIFLGMPAYALGTEFTWFNFIAVGITAVRTVFAAPFGVDYAMWVFYLIIMGITQYFFVRHFTKNTMVSLFSAVATGFSTGLIVFLYIGHVTKLTSLCWYPLIFLLLFRMKEKIRLIDFLLMIITLQLFLQGFHVQIIFYSLLAVGVYFIYYLVRALKQKDLVTRNNLFKSAAVTAGALVIAILIQSDSLTQIYEYTEYSTRGTKGIVELESEGGSKAESDYYQYHTDWSFSPGEVLTFIVPSYYGFGNSKYQGPLTNNQEVEVNTYFGQMRFVDVAMYMGVLVFFLGLFGIFSGWKNPLVRFLTIVTVLALLVSFGRNFPVVFDMLFYYLPYFDKFRVPSMILVLVQMSMPVLAGIGLMNIINLREEQGEKWKKIIRNTAIAAGAVFVLAVLGSSGIHEWFVDRVNAYAASIQASNGQLAQQHKALAEYTADMFVTDMLIAFGFTAAVFWLAVLYYNRKLAADAFVLAVIVLTVIDLWRIDARGAKYVENPDTKNFFQTPDYINVIKAQKEKEPYRIFNLKQDGSLGSFNANSNFNAYFLEEDFYGYSGIKPRAYQDLMDVVGPVNPTLWRMANVKYVVTGQPAEFPGFSLVQNTGQSFVYKFEEALPRLFLVDSVAVKPNLEVLQMIKNNQFDPGTTAFIHEGNIKVNSSGENSYVNITSYKEDNIAAEVQATGNNFLVISTNIVLPGWKAYIDGNETEIHRTNHAFMGIVVPDGKHQVVFKYSPASFFIAKYTMMILSGGVILALVLVGIRRKKQ